MKKEARNENITKMLHHHEFGAAADIIGHGAAGDSGIITVDANAEPGRDRTVVAGSRAKRSANAKDG